MDREFDTTRTIISTLWWIASV